MSKTIKREPLRKQRENQPRGYFGAVSLRDALREEFNKKLDAERSRLEQKYHPDLGEKADQVEFMWRLRKYERALQRIANFRN